MEYKVVIICYTYNQTKYISDALNGFVGQKTNFPYCAVIVDDASDDGQQEIIKEYAIEYPDIIKPIFLPYNHYTRNENKNKYIESWVHRSEYVAFCDGDDYWVSYEKLQKQADYLDHNSECSLTYHACKNLFEDDYSGYKGYFGESVREKYSYVEILKGYPFVLNTVMCRSSILLNAFCSRVIEILPYSSAIFFCMSQFGFIRGINEQLSVYRRDSQGISSDFHNGSRILMLYNAWYEIGNMCEPKVRKNIHDILISSYLCSLYHCSDSSFVELYKREILKFPSTAIIVFCRIFKHKIKSLI